MKHPFDDFISPSWHKKREDKRIVRIGFLLVLVALITTTAAFAMSLSGWHGILKNRGSVTARWDDATTRVPSYVKVQKDIQDAIDEISNIGKFTNSIPRSLLLWSLTDCLPEDTRLEDVRLETRKRVNEDETSTIVESLIVIGIAPSDSSISTYIDLLESTRFFKDVSLMYAQLDTDGHNRNFSVQMILNPFAQATAGVYE
jgi:Tfp pilus assembly protein PilN